MSFGCKLSGIVSASSVQAAFDLVYNARTDAYLAIHADPSPSVTYLTANGDVVGSHIIGSGARATHTSIAFNPDRGEHLAVWSVESTEIFARYLDELGQGRGGAFRIGTGLEPEVAYDPLGEHYVVAFTHASATSPSVRYTVIHGDSASTSPVARAEALVQEDAGGARVSFGSGRVIIVFGTADEGAAGWETIQAAFLDGRGALWPETTTVAVETGQAVLEDVTHTDSQGAWLVTFESRIGDGPSQLKAQLIDDSGVKRGGAISIATERLNEFPSSMAFEASTGTFIAVWRSNDGVRARRIDTANPSDIRLGAPFIVTEDRASAIAVAAGSPFGPPRALFAWMPASDGAVSAKVVRLGTNLDLVGPPGSTWDAPQGGDAMAQSAPNATPPIVNLDALQGTPGAVSGLAAIASSGDIVASAGKSKAVDGDAATVWSSPARPAPVVEFLTVDAGRPRDIFQVHLTTRNVGNLFAEDFEIQVSQNNVDFTTVVTKAGFDSLPGTTYSFPFAATRARYVRFRATKPRRYTDGNYYVQLAEMRVDEALPSETEVILTWTAPDDAEAYDIRYSDSDLTEQNFHLATPVLNVPSPGPPGTDQYVAVTGLSPGSDYYFGMRAIDDAGTESTVSNIVFLSNVDDVAPARVTDLQGLPGAPQSQPTMTVAIGSSGAVNAAFGMDKAVDNNASTAWSTPPRPSMQLEYVTLDVGTIRTLRRVRLRARDLGNLFPEDYAIQVSSDGAFYSTVVEPTGVDVAPGASVTHDFAPARGRFVRLLVTNSRRYIDLNYYVQLAEIEVFEATSDDDAVTLTWTAPGDDDFDGIASEYDLRWSYAPIEDETDFAAVAGNRITIPSPGPPSMTETVFLTGLEPESGYYFAVKTRDDAGNWSEVSTSAPRVDTPSIPPAPVTDLTASNATKTTVELHWSATGDDGVTGSASVYDMRYSTNPITPGNFDTAPEVTGEPSPVGSSFGDPEVMTVGGLSEATLYYFAVKVGDELNTFSSVSNIVMQTTLDEVPPAKIVNLAASPGGVANTPVPVVAINSSGDIGAGYSKDKAVDGNLLTAWSTPGRNVPQNEFLTLDGGATGAPFLIGSVTLCSRNAGSLFPQDFEIRLSTDNIGYSTVASKTGFAAAVGTCYPIELTPSYGRYVQLFITKSPQYYGAYYSQLAELRVDATTLSPGEVTLTWEAPGDNGLIGSAASYDIRYSKSDITSESEFESAQQVATPPTPGPPTTNESFTVTGLDGETRYYFAVRARDGAGNPSEISNVVDFMTASMPPSPVTDLAVKSTDTSSVTLEWSATGDDGMIGIAHHYELRYSTSPIDDANFDLATPVGSMPDPLPASTTQEKTVGGLLEDVEYYFAIRVWDDAPSASLLSNVLAVSTSDETEPSPVTDLTASVAEVLQPAPVTALASSGDIAASYDRHKAVDANPTTAWSTPGRVVAQNELLLLGLAQPTRIGRIALTARNVTGALFPEDFELQVSQNGVDFTTVASRTAFAANAGARFELDFEPTLASYVRLLVTKSRAYTDNRFYVQLAEIEVYRLVYQPGGVRLSWTAPGDNGVQGIAESYDVRISTSEITSENFEMAAEVSNAPEPGPAGSRESFLVTGIQNGTTYFFAVKTEDERDNVSGVSNVIYFPVPPAKITNLQAVGATPESIELSWISTGSDGMVGTAVAYDIRYSTSAISSDAEFDSATQVIGEPAPLVAGTGQSMTVAGLLPDVEYHFAMKVLDESTASDLSNSVSASTLDVVPPGQVLDFSASAGANVLLTWTAPRDNGSVGGPAAFYDIRTSSEPMTDEDAFDLATPVANIPAPGAPGSSESLQVMLPSGLHFIWMKVSDESGNASFAHDQLQVVVGDSIRFAWDASPSPEVGGYELHYGLAENAYTTTVDIGNQTEFELFGLEAGQRYYFAVTAYDVSRSEVSDFSNEVHATFVSP